jgi:hypothetical protein
MNRPILLTFTALPLAAATLALLLAPSGCSPVGCFRASEAGGTCPPRDEALPFFGDPACGGEVASVDSEPSLRNGTAEEGALCCYAVSNKDPEYTDCPDF